MTETIQFISVTPFLVLLCLIAVMPLIAVKFWGNNFVKLGVSVFLSIPVLIYLIDLGHSGIIIHQILFDYIPFIILLGSLFIISGGIYISVWHSGKPSANLMFMIAGAILASLMGTTGASMLLIRPLIRLNQNRQEKRHIIAFFIAIVANTGGLLTPVGDPALFILYLRGIPFEHFISMFPEWLVVNTLLISMFFLLDRYYYSKNVSRKQIAKAHSGLHFSVRGNLNFLLIIGVVLALAIINKKNFEIIEHKPYLIYLRDIVIIGMAGISMAYSNKENLKRNAFSWGPILEVAALFLGIFITMIPAMMYLEQNATLLNLNSTGDYYFMTGFLSSILDNTPTAAIFHSLAQHSGKISDGFINAISMGAVFFGSLTYIGNGPNFMVKSIAENNGIKMPGFFGYIFQFSIVYFLPVYILVYYIFI